jgi:hypothetical protein
MAQILQLTRIIRRQGWEKKNGYYGCSHLLLVLCYRILCSKVIVISNQIGHMESINQPILHIMITTIVCVNRCVCGLIGRALRNAKRAQGQKQTKAASTESSSTTTTAATAAGAGGSSLISPSSGDDMPPHEPHSPALHKSRYQQLVTTQMSTSCVCVT